MYRTLAHAYRGRKHIAPIDAPRYRHLVGTAGTWKLVSPVGPQRQELWKRGFGPFLFPNYWGS